MLFRPKQEVTMTQAVVARVPLGQVAHRLCRATRPSPQPHTRLRIRFRSISRSLHRRLPRRLLGLAQQPAEAPEQEEPEEPEERRHKAGGHLPRLVLVVAREEGRARTEADSKEQAEEHAQKVFGPRLALAQQAVRVAPAPRDEQGRLRIDRTPSVFDAVLDYLRNLDDFVPPDFSSPRFKVLEREARFYGLAGLSALLAERRAKAEEGTAECVLVIDGLPKAISDQEIFELFAALPRTNRTHFGNPVALRMLRDSGGACEGRALAAFTLTAHAIGIRHHCCVFVQTFCRCFDFLRIIT
jgi:hypothetical protein